LELFGTDWNFVNGTQVMESEIGGLEAVLVVFFSDSHVKVLLKCTIRVGNKAMILNTLLFSVEDSLFDVVFSLQLS
jgi:hypothetical protein